jgi:F-type H+-transporting ATPase subunit delta
MAAPEQVSPRHETVMDVTVEQVARVYAQAFMGIAAKSSNPGGLVDELKSLVADVLNPNPKLVEVLESSLVSAEDKESLLDRILGKAASSEVLNFLKVLSRHGRLGLIRTVARQAAKLHAENSGLADVEVRVAAELDDELRKNLEDRLKNRLGKQPVFKVKIDPNLIAGIVVRVGDVVFDGSLQTQLENARRAMIERAIDQIETQSDKFLSAS